MNFFCDSIIFVEGKSNIYYEWFVCVVVIFVLFLLSY